LRLSTAASAALAALAGSAFTLILAPGILEQLRDALRPERVMSRVWEEEVWQQRPSPHPTRADRIFSRLEGVASGLEEDHGEGLHPWGFGESGDLATEASGADLARVLRQTSLLRKTALAFSRDLEPDDARPVLMTTHNFRDVRVAVNLLAEVVVSLFRVGRSDEAVALLAAGHRCARLLGRGTGRFPTLISRMIEVACARTLDEAAALGLRRGWLSGSALEALDAVYQETLDRDLDIGVAFRGEFEMVRLVCSGTEARLGGLAWLSHLINGDPVADLERVAPLWSRAAEGDPVSLKALQDLELESQILRILLPNFPAARERCSNRRTMGRGVRVAIQIERARLAGDLDPRARGSLTLTQDGELFRAELIAHRVVRLYAWGSDGVDDGGDPGKDVVVWR
jgi:hypothetical protein